MKKIIPIIFFAVLLYSCQGAKDALQGKKRSDSGDEFLVEKKNPLTTPPDYNELPVPFHQEQNELDDEDKELEIKKILEINQSEESNSQSTSSTSTSLEKSILEKIND